MDWAFGFLSDTLLPPPSGRAADLIASRIPPGRAVERMSVDDIVQNYDPAILFF